MQLKYSFKKEAAQFIRTFRMIGVILAILSSAVSYPMMFKFTGMVMDNMTGGGNESAPQFTAALFTQGGQAASGGSGGLFDEIDFSEMADMYNDAGMMFATTLVTFAAYGLLITMLILMSAAGGEQKKRAMIVPLCSGLDYKSYLIPKFVLYPVFVFAVSFLCALLAGGLCNSMFRLNHISMSNMALSALLISVYMAFIVSVFISLGLCTSRPGIMAPAVFVGQMFLDSLLTGLGVTRYQPFALLSYINSINSADGGVDVFEEAASIMVSIALAVIIAVLMYFLALGVLKAKKIDNTEENKPEF